MNFILNVMASIIGGAILLGIASILSKKVRWLLISLFSRILDVDIDYVFPNKKASVEDLKKELVNAKFVYVFAGRGNELQRDTFNPLFINRTRDIPTKILLPDIQIGEGEYDWLMQREIELSKFDSAFGNKHLHTQVKTNMDFIQSYMQNNKIELRKYNYPNIGRIIITDRCVFFTPYKEDFHGRHSRVYKFRKNGDMYYNFLRLFNQLWNALTQ